MSTADRTTTNTAGWWLIFIAWLVAMLSTLGSLFFSEIMGLIPCELCWYQRIFMFPLAVILLLGLHPLDSRVIRYALPIAAIGLLFTIYHSLLFYGLIPENLQPCRQGISCADDGMVLFDILPIPLLSLAAFVAIIILLLKAHRLLNQNNHQTRNTL
ncbi:MAG: disulfide bond formation protein B [Gammaproteobacteria bacterium]|nr:disulfide bond formation protein B [Gammaproteobacteria bacterium]MCF6258929.1 disulfide bond formation protein B [Gammaproteobacteria bacterium]